MQDTIDIIETINGHISEDRLNEAATVLSDLEGDRWETVVREMADKAAQVNHGATTYEAMYAMAGRLETLASIVERAGAKRDPMA